MTKDTSNTSQKGQSSQYTKWGPTKPRESISGRRNYKPEYHKFSQEKGYVNELGSL